jgi:hypothetical protein
VGWAAHPVRLDAGSSRSLAGGALIATWNFGDGSPGESGGLQVSHVYQEPGVYSVSVTVSDGAIESEAATTTVEVLPGLGADSLSVTPSCGDGGTQITVRGLAKAPSASLLDGGWDLAEGPLRPADVELVLPWGSASATPVAATLVFERTLTVPAAIASGEHTIAVAGGPGASFVIPCPAAGDQRPLADAGGPLYGGGVDKPVTFDGSASRDPEGEALAFAWDFGDGTTGTGARPRHSYAAAGVYFVTLVVNDGRHDSALGIGTHSYALALVTADGVPPTTTASASPAANAAGWNRNDVTVELTARDDEGGSSVKEIVYALAGAQSGGATVAGSSAQLEVSAEGVTTVSYFARDNAGNAEQPRTLTIRIDRTAPTLACAAAPSRLWPPDHRLVPIAVSVQLADELSGAAGFVLVAATSSEPDNGLGDGDRGNDVQGFAAGTADTAGRLRAERSGTGSGRVYSVVYEASDAAANSARCTVRVTVPHDG